MLYTIMPIQAVMKPGEAEPPQQQGYDQDCDVVFDCNESGRIGRIYTSDPAIYLNLYARYPSGMV